MEGRKDGTSRMLRIGHREWTWWGVLLFAALGLVVRMVRYGVVYPIWHDEAFLAVNFWDRDYLDLLRPLDYGQVAPWLFLAIERTAVLWLGYSEAVLRLFPTVSSILSVPLFVHICRQLLPGRAQVVATAIFATSVYTVRHGAEIKPYASDLLVALILIALALQWVKSPQQGRWWWILAALMPLVVPLSYPSVFVAGGIGAALGAAALRSERMAVRMGCAIYGVVLIASFLAFFAASASFQAEAMRDEYRTGCWADSFPPWSQPWRVPIWLLDIHAGTMMAYPAGDRHGGSAATLLGVLAGGWVLYRRGQRQALGVLVAPFSLGLLAACLGRYPYGGAPRIMQYVAPSICLLAGLGLDTLLHRLRNDRYRRNVWITSMTGFAALGLGLVGRDLVWPYRVESDLRTREFARWLWSTDSTGTLTCLKSDLGMSFFPREWSVGMSAVYLHHQHIYSDRHRRSQSIDLVPAGFSEGRPLRLVSFGRMPTDAAAFNTWLNTLTKSFEIRQTDVYVIQPGKPGEDWLRDACEVVELVPRPQLATDAEARSHAKLRR